MSIIEQARHLDEIAAREQFGRDIWSVYNSFDKFIRAAGQEHPENRISRGITDKTIFDVYTGVEQPYKTYVEGKFNSTVFVGRHNLGCMWLGGDMTFTPDIVVIEDMKRADEVDKHKVFTSETYILQPRKKGVILVFNDAEDGEDEQDGSYHYPLNPLNPEHMRQFAGLQKILAKLTEAA